MARGVAATKQDSIIAKARHEICCPYRVGR